MLGEFVTKQHAVIRGGIWKSPYLSGGCKVRVGVRFIFHLVVIDCLLLFWGMRFLCGLLKATAAQQ